ncbi:DUF3732 domain-containing protein [Cellvibrio sp. UBA7671]|uniref:DUF3732 domain-containing protein n=1 Tax=Cellvibrio sp. UBA7671 TaxID=1946312 RepID=UPI002F353F50
MKTFIHELGVIDKIGKTHPVKFKKGLNVVTGKSSTGKSALIEIFDYCFGSSEYTVPKGVITDSAAIYYVYINVNGQHIVLGRLPDNGKAFFRREEKYSPEKINTEYFISTHFRPLKDYLKIVRDLFLDIDDVDESLFVRENRKNNAKSPTPSIRSFASFMLQHQNLVANKHALFYRFDEKAKRDQAIDHSKIFLGLVDQEFFLLSQEKESLTFELSRIKKEQEANVKLANNQKQKIEPVLRQLYSVMGFEHDPVSLGDIFLHPQNAKERLNSVIRPENIEPLSGIAVQRHISLQRELAAKTAQLRKLQRQSGSIYRHIEEEERFVTNGIGFNQDGTVNVAKSVCPFCHTEHEQLQESAQQLQQAIFKLSNNLIQAKPMRAKFDLELAKIKHDTNELSEEISKIKSQANELEQIEKQMAEKKSLYELILQSKAKLDVLIDSLSLADDSDVERRLEKTKSELKDVMAKLNNYNYQDGMRIADETVNGFMVEIGKHFEFESSYKPINLHFSFENFDLYHLTPKDEKIFLRSMGSGANWLYCHVTLFLALHKYFASLGEQCAIPSILFLDQPTQVYFPSFKLDKSEQFNKELINKLEHRDGEDYQTDDDMEAVENLFSQLSIYCTETQENYGFSPQIIVTDHTDNLTLSDGTDFESLVYGNRWRTRGLIEPVPSWQE